MPESAESVRHWALEPLPFEYAWIKGYKPEPVTVQLLIARLSNLVGTLEEIGESLEEWWDSEGEDQHPIDPETRRLPDPEETPLMTVAEAGAVAYNLARAASYNAARRGDLPTIRVGNRLWVPTAQLRAKLGLESARWLAEQPPAGRRQAGYRDLPRYYEQWLMNAAYVADCQRVVDAYHAALIDGCQDSPQ